ncbi:hypothetical protein BV22DRAFT_849314 [Leucogyrophana mollusca]|uniref:Uncharacterized protein n=1 Tax=Leucogyrophana mollusca TaxID=85980 RepID=A0ACB8B3L7_9AGAM|nr:hypothetical protein BV22DRAFT_849314 [Leucogyrophana mollusca]
MNCDVERVPRHPVGRRDHSPPHPGKVCSRTRPGRGTEKRGDIGAYQCACRRAQATSWTKRTDSYSPLPVLHPPLTHASAKWNRPLSRSTPNAEPVFLPANSPPTPRPGPRRA